MSLHTPVLLEAVLEALRPGPGGTIVDATLGTGGHAEEILKKSAPDGKLIGFELDPRNAEIAEKRLSPFRSRAIVVRQSYGNLRKTLHSLGIEGIDGILFDLGVSSLHLDDPARGFSFRQDGPLDMRFSRETNHLTAAEILAHASAYELTRIFREYGEAPYSERYAKAIVDRRTDSPFKTTVDLADFILSLSPRSSRLGGGHPAALVFQALRIAVNHELDALKDTLPATLPLLHSGARIAVISFHSLEDRIVKEFFRKTGPKEKRQKYPRKAVSQNFASKLKILTKPCTLPTRWEIEQNPRARSARMRVAEKL